MIVVFGQKKGGSQKTLTGFNVAVAAAHKGMSVCVVDTDINQSMNGLISKRNKLNAQLEEEGKPTYPFIKSEIKRPEDNLLRDLKDLDEKYDLIIVDTAGAESDAFKSSIKVSDYVYIPFQPCEVDMDQLVPTLKVIIETESFGKMHVPEYKLNPRLLLVGAEHKSRDLVQEAKEFTSPLCKYSSLSSATIQLVKEVKKLQGSGLGLSDVKHVKRAMYEILLDEILGKRSVSRERVE